MALYKYRAQDANGSVVKGELEANDLVDLQAQLKTKNLSLLSSQEMAEHLIRSRCFKPQVLSSFCFRLSKLLRSGVPLVRSLSIIAEEEDVRPQEGVIYAQLIADVKKGNRLSEAMENANGAFPALLQNMVKAAEETGDLAEVFSRMSSYYEKEYRFTSKIKQATLYPKILCVVVVLVVIIIVGFVLPQFEELFSQMDELPLATAILLAITDFCQVYWLQIIIAFFALIVLWKVLTRISVIRIQVDRVKLKLPLIGKQNRVVSTANFARSFASLYTSGINAITALDIASRTTGNLYLEHQFGDVIDSVRSGHALSEAFGNIDGFVNKFVSSVRIGEESGELENMLTSTADTLDFEAQAAIERMIGYLEPAMIVVMAVVVGFVMIAIIVPIYSSYSTIGASTTSY